MEQLTIADLVALRNTVDLACTRGAFRGEEMKDVGMLFERLTGFIAQVQSQYQPAPQDEPSTEPAPESQGE